MKLTYLGHSAFEIETKGNKILIDPFLVMSPNYNPAGVTDIFVTHAHSDHLGSAIEISKKTGAKITAIFELANYCSSKGAGVNRVNGINLGGKIERSWGTAVSVPAFHSSMTSDGIYGGCPCGYVFTIEGQHIYHAGDTCINSEMKVIGDLFEPEIALLPIGGTYTMNVEQAVIAADWLRTDTVIPMHYNTFDAIKADTDSFRAEIKNIGKKPLILAAGETINL